MRDLGELLAAAGPLEYVATLVGVLALVTLYVLYWRERKVRDAAESVAAPAAEHTVVNAPADKDVVPAPSNVQGAFKTYIPSDDSAAG